MTVVSQKKLHLFFSIQQSLGKLRSNIYIVIEDLLNVKVGLH